MRYLTKPVFFLCQATLLCSPLIYAESLLAQAVIEEVVVTAQKREESLSDVPISITALTPEILDNDNIQSLADMSAMAPGLVVARNEGFSRVVSIRGIGFEATQNVDAYPSVAFHIDGVFIADPNATNLEFIDVDRIEVMRGPQGTLFGQNSTGGAINVVNRTPELGEFSGTADIAIGNYSLVQPRAAINLPLGETVAVRAAATYLTHDGFAEIVGGAQDINGQVNDGYDLDEADNFQFQGKLLWQPTDNFSAILGATVFSINDVGDRGQRHVNDPSGDIRKVTSDVAGQYDAESSIYSLTLEYDAGIATVKSITGYVEFDQANYLDNDKGVYFMGAPWFAGLAAESLSERGSETLTQEINVVSNTGGRLNWVVGAFYLDNEGTTWFDSVRDLNGNGVFDQGGTWKGTGQTRAECAPDFATFTNGFFFGERDFCTNIASKRTSWSLYGEVNVDLTERLRLTGGLRHTDDELALRSGGFSAAPPDEPTQNPQDSQLTGKAGFEFDLTDNLMTYFAWTRGFKPATGNLTAEDSDEFINAASAPEQVDAFEAGAKGQFMDGRMSLNAAAFYYDYNDMQFLTTGANATFSGGVGNLDEAEIMGLELELQALLSDSLSLDAGLTFLDTEITADQRVLDNNKKWRECAVPAFLRGENVNFGPEANPRFRACGSALAENIRGNPLPKAPEFSANIALNYMFSTALGEINSRLSFIHRDSFASRVFSTSDTDFRGVSLDTTEGYELINLSVYLKPANYENLTLGLLVFNLNDEGAVNSRWSNNFGTAQTSEEFVRPRQIIGRVSYSF
ncbi:MAG: TonB-dependent receptor [Gammaproteobacteria bacterium]|nr:TonB-dependent receptor [Gammaproteobacteria bacterium]MXW46055.1 TonB-dependent receptor [Gammaproteobacteria bacterium]MYD02719.1 TonB-dependent receptor [Gammaproteobacteria bacterium]MYI25868.1 TonB-dependent receptor [Gammaproteobacteria bacterium]